MKKVAKKLQLCFYTYHSGLLGWADRRKEGHPLYLDYPSPSGGEHLFPGYGPFSFLPSGASLGKRGSQGSTSEDASSKSSRGHAANVYVRWQVLDNKEQWGLW